MGLDQPLWVASVVGPRPDPAFNRKHPEWMNLAQEYARTRDPRDLAKLPLHEGKHPRLFAVDVLTPRQYASLSRMPDQVDRELASVCCAVLRVKHGDGRVESAPIAAKGDGGSAADVEKWPATLQALGGMNLVSELASVVMQRAESGDPEEGEGTDPLARFALPRGLLLAR